MKIAFHMHWLMSGLISLMTFCMGLLSRVWKRNGYRMVRPKSECNNVVLLFEGTENEPVDNPSVISKLERLLSCDGQKVHLETGSGTRGCWICRRFNSVTGWDSYRIVSRQYRWLCKYLREHGLSSRDIKLHIFGFSRGAYQARLFVALVRRFGIGPERRYRSVLAMCVRSFAIRHLLKLCPRKWHGEWPTVEYVGLFDTVSSVLFRPILAYADSLPDDVLVRHAVALHEYRRKFKPELLHLDREEKPVEASNCKEKLFIGAHSDVGWAFNGAREEWLYPFGRLFPCMRIKINHAHTRLYGKIACSWILDGDKGLSISDRYDCQSLLNYENPPPISEYRNLASLFIFVLHNSTLEPSNLYGVWKPRTRSIKCKDYAAYHFSAEGVLRIYETINRQKGLDIESAEIVEVLLGSLQLKEYDGRLHRINIDKRRMLFDLIDRHLLECQEEFSARHLVAL